MPLTNLHLPEVPNLANLPRLEFVLNITRHVSPRATLNSEPGLYVLDAIAAANLYNKILLDYVAPHYPAWFAVPFWEAQDSEWNRYRHSEANGLKSYHDLGHVDRDVASELLPDDILTFLDNIKYLIPTPQARRSDVSQYRGKEPGIFPAHYQPNSDKFWKWDSWHLTPAYVNVLLFTAEDDITERGVEGGYFYHTAARGIFNIDDQIGKKLSLEQYGSLMEFLERTLWMWQTGRFVIEDVPEDDDDEEEERPPIRTLKWNYRVDDDVCDAISAYNELIEAIVTAAPTTDQTHENISLLHTDLARWPMSNFARSFLAKARTPSWIRQIAPGIGVWTPAAFEAIMTADNERGDRHAWVAELLDRQRRKHGGDPHGFDRSDDDDDDTYPYHELFRKTTTQRTYFLLFPSTAPPVPAILLEVGPRPDAEYVFQLTEENPRWWLTERMLGLYQLGGRGFFRDGVKLITGVGANEDKAYQHLDGCPYLGDHEVGLATVLRLWARMVREGKWSVDSEGVIGVVGWHEETTAPRADTEFSVGRCWALDVERERS